MFTLSFALGLAAANAAPATDVDAIKKAATEVRFSHAIARKRKSPRVVPEQTCELQVWSDTRGRAVAAEATGCDSEAAAAWEDAAVQWRFQPFEVENTPTPFTFRIDVQGRDGSLSVIENPIDPALLPPPTQAPDGRYEVRVKRRVAPTYPTAAKRLNLDEVPCRVQVTIDEGGIPYRVDDVDCPKVFHESAREALFQWRWYPAKIDGEVVHATFAVVIRYRLRSGRGMR